MRKSEQCLLLTDSINLPHNNTFSGKIHGLTKAEAGILGDNLHYDLVFSTPKDALELLESVSVLFDRTLAYSDQVREIHERCSKLGISYINYPPTMEIFANKYLTYEALRGSRLQQPFTKQIKSDADLNNFTIRTGVGNRFVVKPTWGGLGDWVTFVDVTGNEQIKAFWKSDGTIEIFSGRPKDFFHQALSKQEENANGNSRTTQGPIEWIAQDYLDITDADGLARDIRVIEQRDRSGRMKVSNMHGRRGSSPDLPLTNLSKGGYACEVMNILEGTGITVDQLVDFCGKIDSVIEKLTGRFIGEVGHDVAVVRSKNSRHFNLFYIEGNTMPGYVLESWDVIKNSQITENTLNSLTPADHILLARPLEYVNHLIDLRAVASIKS